MPAGQTRSRQLGTRELDCRGLPESWGLCTARTLEDLTALSAVFATRSTPLPWLHGADRVRACRRPRCSLTSYNVLARKGPRYPLCYALSTLAEAMAMGGA